MNFSTLHGDVASSDADTIIVNHFLNDAELGPAAARLDKRLGGTLNDLLAAAELSGERDGLRVLYTGGEGRPRRVIVVGLGERATFDRLAARNAAARAVQAAAEHGAERVASVVHGDGAEAGELAQATAEGALLALHVYRPQQKRSPSELVIYTSSAVEADGAARGEIVADGVKLARDLTFAPANVATPVYLAEVAQQMAAQYGLEIMVGDRAWVTENGMGLMQAVAQGAQNEPRFIVLEHKGAETQPIVLVGKGITFDSGGLSLKSTSQITAMKFDMAGAAAVLGAMQTVARLNLPLHIVGICPCTENMPDGAAYRPSDVLTASDGTTVEIISTDAEGRLVLGDALVYAARYKPQAVIDLATLTGTAVRAMGKGVAAALFSNDERLQQRLVAAGDESHERVWPFPLYEDYRKAIESPVADIKNSGGADGGLGASAAFLQTFVAYPWAHIDIAGVALAEKGRAQAYERHEASGFGVRLLVEMLRKGMV